MSELPFDSAGEGNEAAASPPPVSLSVEVQGRMRSLGLPVVLPSWLPEGFSLLKATAERHPAAGGFSECILQGPEGAFLQISVAQGGVGDVFRGSARHSFDNPFFGSGALEWYSADSDEGVDFRSPWLSVSPEGFPVVMLTGQGLPPEHAVRVVESLRPVASRPPS